MTFFRKWKRTWTSMRSYLQKVKLYISWKYCNFLQTSATDAFSEFIHFRTKSGTRLQYTLKITMAEVKIMLNFQSVKIVLMLIRNSLFGPFICIHLFAITTFAPRRFFEKDSFERFKNWFHLFFIFFPAYCH